MKNDLRFKGVNKQDKGNANVGGKISHNKKDTSTPSYVLIQSNFPYDTDPYQAVTVFGSNSHDDRATFCLKIGKIGGIKIDW